MATETKKAKIERELLNMVTLLHTKMMSCKDKNSVDYIVAKAQHQTAYNAYFIFSTITQS